MYFKQFLDLIYLSTSAMTSVDAIFAYGLSYIFLFFWYRKKRVVDEATYGYSQIIPYQIAFIRMAEGFLGGLIATTIIYTAGITISSESIINILVIASIVMGIISPNFLNIVYACSVVSIFWAKESDIYALVAISAVMVLVQGILVLLSGYREANAVILKNENGENFGGYIVNNIWPVFIGVIILNATHVAADGMNTPHWWPMFPVNLKDTVYMMSGMFLFVGNSKSIYSETKTKKSIFTGISYIVYGGVFIYISYIFKQKEMMGLVLVLLSTLFYATIDILLNDTSSTRYKKFKSNEDIVVLDVISYTIAEYADIKPMDKILSINSIAEKTVEGLNRIIRDNLKLDIQLERDGQNINIKMDIQLDENLDYEDRPKGLYDIGIIVVPPTNSVEMGKNIDLKL